MASNDSTPCSDSLCPCHDHNDERPLPDRDPKTEYCFRIARYFIEDKYENVPVDGLNWIAKRVRQGIEDDLDDLEAKGHITKAKVPF